MEQTTYPDIRTLVDAVLDVSHTPTTNCWWFVQYLFREGRGILFDEELALNAMRVQEFWWHEDPVPLADVIQPYDLLLFHVNGPIADHIGVVVDQRTFCHSREKAGVCYETIHNWLPRCLQAVRVQETFPRLG